MFSLKLPRLCDSNEYTQYTIFNIKMKISLNYPKSAANGYFQGTQEQVRNSRGKRAVNVLLMKYLGLKTSKHTYYARLDQMVR